MRKALTLILLLVTSCLSLAQGGLPKYAVWTATLADKDARAGESTQILLTVQAKDGWHVYGLKELENGPANTDFKVTKGALEANGDQIQPPAIQKFDKNFKMDVELHEGKSVFALPVKLKADATGKQSATVEVRSQACNDRTCAIPATDEIEIEFTVAPGQARPEKITAVTTVPEQPAGKVIPPPSSKGEEVKDEFTAKVTAAKQSGLAAFLWLAFSAGLVALLTPCVFPMIPITVSFFAKQADKGGSKYAAPVAYCLGIIGTFTAVGLLATILFGATGIQQLAANAFVNLGLTVLFIVLAANLFGLFEISLPSGLVNKFGSQRGNSGVVPALLMGLTFTLTSFTCTVPLVGTLLLSATQGDLLYPILGMLAFSTAFALPFFLLALFPQYLAKLPKSGSWLATVKVFMGFLELAAALKFLSNVDLVWNLGWITRPVFLAVWVAIFAVAGFYMIGWLKLGFEEGKAKIGWVRRLVGVGTLASAIYLLGAIEGAPLGTFSAFMPPDPYPGKTSGSKAARLSWNDTFEAAKAESDGKLIFIDFTGVTCTNCRQMEDNVFPDPDVEKALKTMSRAKLYTDRPTDADRANVKLMIEMTKSTTLPNYVVASPDGKPIRVFQGSTFDTAAFAKFLKG
jgi:thiol:disulfide interchange protein DsbD